MPLLERVGKVGNEFDYEYTTPIVNSCLDPWFEAGYELETEEGKRVLVKREVREVEVPVVVVRAGTTISPRALIARLRRYGVADPEAFIRRLLEEGVLETRVLRVPIWRPPVIRRRRLLPRRRVYIEIPRYYARRDVVVSIPRRVVRVVDRIPVIEIALEVYPTGTYHRKKEKKWSRDRVLVVRMTKILEIGAHPPKGMTWEDVAEKINWSAIRDEIVDAAITALVQTAPPGADFSEAVGWDWEVLDVRKRALGAETLLEEVE